MERIRVDSGSEMGNALGFTSDLFSGWFELEKGRKLYLHYIISRKKNEGNTQALIRRWLSEGYDLHIIMPRPIMRHILEKFRFVHAYEYIPDHYEYPVEVWRSAESLPGFCHGVSEKIKAESG